MRTEYEMDGKTGQAEVMTGELFDGSKAVAAINRAEVDIQIATAKTYPRTITAFKRTVMDLATLDQPTARTMFYVLPPRDEEKKKPIEGPSVRMAEVVAYAWGNIRALARIVSIDEKFVTAQGVCFDLERNVSASVEVKRGITTKKGHRYSDDMIRVTCSAAGKIAYREAVFAVVPRSLFKEAYEAARLAAVGKGETTTAARESWLQSFEAKGIKRADILKKLGRKGVDDLTTDDLIILAGIDNAINDGEVSIAEAFADEEVVKPASAPTRDLNERIARAATSATVQMDPRVAAVAYLDELKPSGGDATDGQRERLREHGVKLFADGSALRAKFFDVVDSEHLGKGQAGKLVGLTALAVDALQLTAKL